MSGWMIRYGIAGALLGSLILLLGRQSPRSERSSPIQGNAGDRGHNVAAAVSIDPSELHFGDVWSQPAFPWTVTLHNATQRSVRLQDVQSDCTCTSVEPRTATIAPGGSLPIRLVLDLRYDPEKTSPSPRDFAVDLKFVFGAKTPPITERLHGRVLPNPIGIEPRDVLLGEVVVTDPSSYEHSIALSSQSPLGELTAASRPGTTAEVTVLRDSSSHRKAALHLSLNRSLPIGLLKLFVDLRIERGADDPPMLLSLPVRGEVVQDVESIPTALLIGARPVRSEFRKDVTFRSRTGRLITSAEVENVPEGFNIARAASFQVPAVAAAFRVIGHVTEKGSQKVELRFRFQLEGLEKPSTVSLPISYHGLPQSTEAPHDAD